MDKRFSLEELDLEMSVVAYPVSAATIKSPIAPQGFCCNGLYSRFQCIVPCGKNMGSILDSSWSHPTEEIPSSRCRNAIARTNFWLRSDTTAKLATHCERVTI